MKMKKQNIELDNERSLYDCSNFNFSSKRISEINNYMKQLSNCSTFSSTENEELFKQLNLSMDSITRENIKSQIFVGNQKLIQNYLIWKNKYPIFNNQDINEMIYEGQRILLDSIDEYRNSNDVFSTYLFRKFKEKIQKDFIEKSHDSQKYTEENKKEYGNIDLRKQVNVKLNGTLDKILKKLKGKSIKFYPCYKNARVNIQQSDLTEKYFENMDYYDMEDLEEGKKI